MWSVRINHRYYEFTRTEFDKAYSFATFWGGGLQYKPACA